MITTIEQIDNILKKAKIGDRGFFNKKNGKEYCVAKKWKNNIGEHKNFVYLVNIENIKKLKIAVNKELGIMVNADWLYREFDYENLLNKGVLRISTLKKIQVEDIWFEDGLLIENGIVNALTTMDREKIESIFGLEDLKNADGYYDLYLDYDSKKESCVITIVAVTDNNRNYYTYIPSSEEQEMLKKSLEEYAKTYEGKSIQELVNEIEEIEQE